MRKGELCRILGKWNDLNGRMNGGSVECYSSSFVYHVINWCEWGGKLLIGTQDNNKSLEKHEFVKLLADRVVGHQPLFE